MDGLRSEGTLRLNLKDWWKDSLKTYSESGHWKQEMEKSWRKESDPETGDRWQERKSRKETHPILNRTGKMFKTAQILPTARGGLEVATTSYGEFHMTGTSGIPERRWASVNEAVLEKLAETAIDRIFSNL